MVKKYAHYILIEVLVDYIILSAIIMKSVKTQKAKMKFAKEPFCFGEFLISLPSKVITGANIEDSFFELTKDIDKFYIGCAILETVRTIVVSGEKNVELFIETLKD